MNEFTNTNHQRDEETAVYKAAWEFIQQPYFVLDTETTGLDGYAQVCQVAVVDQTGEVIFDELVRPEMPIPPDASRIHGITNERVANSPFWPELHPYVYRLISHKRVAVYNLDFDIRILTQTNRIYGLPGAPLAEQICVMQLAARWYGDWSDWHQNYRWQKLTTIAYELGIDTTGAHDAAADAKMTWRVLRALAANYDG